jgi:hypothetical protein
MIPDVSGSEKLLLDFIFYKNYKSKLAERSEAKARSEATRQRLVSSYF